MSRLMLMALTFPFVAAPADAKAEADARLDAVLREWAKAGDAVHEAHFTIRVSERDAITDRVSTFSYEVFVRKPDLMRVDVKDHKSGPEWIIYKDRTVRLLTSADKIDRSFPLSESFGFPEHPERYPDDFFSSIGGEFLEQHSWLAFGLPVRDLKSRFNLRLSKEPVRDLKSRFNLRLSKEDDNYLYIEIEPRKKKDRINFDRMQVVLNRKTYQVRRLRREHPDATQMTYDYERSGEDSVEPITPKSILKGLPADYKLVDMGRLFEDLRKANGDAEKPAMPLKGADRQ